MYVTFEAYYSRLLQSTFSFYLKFDDRYNVSGELETLVDLRGYWGTYDIGIHVSFSRLQQGFYLAPVFFLIYINGPSH